MGSPLKNFQRNHPGATGFGSKVAKGGIGYGTARLLARHCHGKKDSGNVPTLIAALGKGLPALANLFMGDRYEGAIALVGEGFDGAGQGALDFLGVVHGLRDVRAKKGIKVFAVPTSADVKALPAGTLGPFTEGELVGEEAVLGHLGYAQPGASMSLDRLRELQTYR